jgi:hypothetical protein
MQLCNGIYYSKVYWKLNMFRAEHRSSSGTRTVFAASGLYTHVVTGRCQGWVGNFAVFYRLHFVRIPVFKHTRYSNVVRRHPVWHHCVGIRSGAVNYLYIIYILTFICLRATLLSYDFAHRAVRSWCQNSFDCFSRWPWNTLRNPMCGVACCRKEWGEAFSSIFTTDTRSWSIPDWEVIL